MKNTSINIIRYFTLAVVALVAFSAVANAADPIIRKGRGSYAGSILTEVNLFKYDLGGDNNGNGGYFTTGRREINWEDAPDIGDNFDEYYYNQTIKRGMVISSPCGDTAGIRVSKSGNNPLRFSDIEPTYLDTFKAYSGQRIASSYNYGLNEHCNIIDISFFIPGTNIPAAVNGFGIVATDVGGGLTSITYWGKDGMKPLDDQFILPQIKGFSFVGLSTPGEYKITRVRIELGNSTLGEGLTDSGVAGGRDVVAIDDIIYGEPRAIGQHAGDFDGDGMADMSIFRPSNGVWYILQSGSNTFTAAQFGQNGDVPVEGDFDGDARNDYAVFRPSNGVWYILQTSNNQARYAQFGLSGDKPVVADYDRDGKTDIAVWRNGIYHILQSSNNQYKTAQWGMAGDIPIGTSLSQ